MSYKNLHADDGIKFFDNFGTYCKKKKDLQQVLDVMRLNRRIKNGNDQLSIVLEIPCRG